MDTFLILLIIPHNYCSRAVKEFVRSPLSLSLSLSLSHDPITLDNVSFTITAAAMPPTA
jgi:hypothetical protein